MMDLPSAPRAFWLLARLRLLRLLNIGNALRFRKGWLGPSRAPTRSKKNARWLVTFVLSAFMLAAFLNTASTSLLNMQCRLPTGSQCAPSNRTQRRAWPCARRARNCRRPPSIPC